MRGKRKWHAARRYTAQLGEALPSSMAGPTQRCAPYLFSSARPSTCALHVDRACQPCASSLGGTAKPAQGMLQSDEAAASTRGLLALNPGSRDSRACTAPPT